MNISTYMVPALENIIISVEGNTVGYCYTNSMK